MTIHQKDHGRYIDDSRLFTLVKELDTRGTYAIRTSNPKNAQGGADMAQGGVEVAQMAQSGATKLTKRSSEITAAKVGTSSRKVERIRTILDKGTEDLWLLIESGKISINAAYQTVRNISIPKPQRTVSEVFIKCIRMMIPDEKYLRNLSNNELVLVEHILKVFRSEGHLNLKEFEELEKTIILQRE